MAGIESVEIIPGQCEVIDEGQEFSVIVDSADTPEVGGVLGARSGEVRVEWQRVRGWSREEGARENEGDQ